MITLPNVIASNLLCALLLNAHASQTLLCAGLPTPHSLRTAGLPSRSHTKMTRDLRSAECASVGRPATAHGYAALGGICLILTSGDVHPNRSRRDVAFLLPETGLSAVWPLRPRGFQGLGSYNSRPRPPISTRLSGLRSLHLSLPVTLSS